MLFVQTVECGVLDVLLPSLLLLSEVREKVVCPILFVCQWVMTSGWKGSGVDIRAWNGRMFEILSSIVSVSSLPETTVVRLLCDKSVTQWASDMSRKRGRQSVGKLFLKGLLWMSTSLSHSGLIVFVNVSTTAVLASLVFLWFRVFYPTIEDVLGKRRGGEKDWIGSDGEIVWQTVAWFVCLLFCGSALWVMWDVCREWYWAEVRQRNRESRHVEWLEQALSQLWGGVGGMSSSFIPDTATNKGNEIVAVVVNHLEKEVNDISHTVDCEGNCRDGDRDEEDEEEQSSSSVSNSVEFSFFSSQSLEL